MKKIEGYISNVTQRKSEVNALAKVVDCSHLKVISDQSNIARLSEDESTAVKKVLIKILADRTGALLKKEAHLNLIEELLTGDR